MNNNIEEIIIFGDVHLEQQTLIDPSYILFKKVVSSLKPDRIICLGDLMDCSYISRFSEGIAGEQEGKRLKADFEIFKNEMQWLKKHSKQKPIFLEGNHEIRLNKYLDKNPILKGLFCLEDYAKEVDVEYIPLENQPYQLYNDLYITHGICFGTHFCKTMVNKVGNSIIAGHTHRTQLHSISYPDGRVITGYGIGTLGPVNPDYTAGLRVTEHTHSFGQLLVDRNTDYKQFNIIDIKDNKCIINKKLFENTKIDESLSLIQE